MRDLPAGWIIPIVILILISFPPLFGHELVALLCGVIYGLWEGFLVVAAGTFLGEGEFTRPLFHPVAPDRVCGALTFGHPSRNLVCLQVLATKEGLEAGKDQPELCVIGAVDP